MARLITMETKTAYVNLIAGTSTTFPIITLLQAYNYIIVTGEILLWTKII